MLKPTRDRISHASRVKKFLFRAVRVERYRTISKTATFVSTRLITNRSREYVIFFSTPRDLFTKQIFGNTISKSFGRLLSTSWYNNIFHCLAIDLDVRWLDTIRCASDRDDECCEHIVHGHNSDDDRKRRQNGVHCRLIENAGEWENFNRTFQRLNRSQRRFSSRTATRGNRNCTDTSRHLPVTYRRSYNYARSRPSLAATQSANPITLIRLC